MRSTVRLLIASVVIATVAGGVVVLTPLGYPILRAAFSPGEITTVVWSELRLNNEPARYLVCPGFEMCAELNDRTAVFDASVSRLMREWGVILGQDEEGMELVLADEEARQYTYLIRSLFLQLPDLVTVEFVEYDEDEDIPRSSLAIYSRRVYVSGDFGANSRRVFGYLDHSESTLGIYRR